MGLGLRCRVGALWGESCRVIPDAVLNHTLKTLKTKHNPKTPHSLLAACAAGSGGVNCTQCGPGFFSAGGSTTNLRPNCTACPANVMSWSPGAANTSMCTGAQAPARAVLTAKLGWC